MPPFFLAALLTMITVDPDDPAFHPPGEVRRPRLRQRGRRRVEKGWVFKPDGNSWRRVVPSPQPQEILEIQPIRWLLERGAVVMFAGGGAVPHLVLGLGVR